MHCSYVYLIALRALIYLSEINSICFLFSGIPLQAVVHLSALHCKTVTRDFQASNVVILNYTFYVIC